MWVTCISCGVLEVETLSLIFWIVTIHDLFDVFTPNCVFQPFRSSFLGLVFVMRVCNISLIGDQGSSCGHGKLFTGPGRGAHTMICSDHWPLVLPRRRAGPDTHGDIRGSLNILSEIGPALHYWRYHGQGHLHYLSLSGFHWKILKKKTDSKISDLLNQIFSTRTW